MYGGQQEARGLASGRETAMDVPVPRPTIEARAESVMVKAQRMSDAADSFLARVQSHRLRDKEPPRDIATKEPIRSGTADTLEEAEHSLDRALGTMDHALSLLS